MADEAHEVQQVILRLHQALKDKDTEAALGCYGETYLRTGRGAEASSNDPAAWRAEYSTHEEIRTSMEGFASPDTTYTSTVEF